MKRLLVLVTLICGMSADVTGADKTLVSWAMLKDKNVRAGSVLTVQVGDQFDGIVFAELAEAKWMAGSNHFRRTNTDQEDYPREDADANTLVQMAIVFKGNEITIYRNGEEYASHEASNIDLLSNPKNYVVFGLRHIGGKGQVAAQIEDARIYDKALSQEEIKSLEPNKESSIKPFAWWDFEGDTMKDRMGRYPHSKLDSGAKLAAGKLDLGRNGNVLACPTEKMVAELSDHLPLPPFTGPYVPETPEWPEDPPDNWAIYHLAHPTFTMGSPFDPNPVFFFNGRYHLHYIYRNRTGFVFGHVSSKDMVRWKWHPTVLAPPNTGHGMFSGTGFLTKDGRAAAVYHGQGSDRNWIVYAQDDNLDKWSKPEVMLPRDEDGNLMTNVRYFDPDIWLMDGKYYGLNARSSKEAPSIMKSDNLKDWTYIGELLHPDFDEKKLGVERAEDISCPNFFKLGNKWVLVCISHRLGCRYFIGDFQNEQFLPEQHALMGGLSNRYFAPESLLTPDGRRVNWAWFFGGQTKGVQSLPVEMELPDDGIMRYRPLRELESLRYDERSCENVKVNEEAPVLLEIIKGIHLELEMFIKNPGDESLGIDVLCDEHGRSGLRISVDRKAGMLFVGEEKAPFQLKKNEPLTLRVFVDTTLVEVFANERQYVITDKPREAGEKINDRIAVFSHNGDLTVDKLTGWQMKSAFEGDTVFKGD
jgi:sucrose-6-phosphate hydrolase SacC (GH32 family)